MVIAFKAIAGIAYAVVMLAIATFAINHVPTRERRIKFLLP